MERKNFFQTKRLNSNNHFFYLLSHILVNLHYLHCMNQQAYPRSLHIVQKNATSYCTPFLNYKLLVVRSSDAHVSVLQSFCLCTQCCPSQICNSQFSVIAGTYYPVSRFFLCSHVQDWWEIQVEVKLVGSNWEHWYYNVSSSLKQKYFHLL